MEGMEKRVMQLEWRKKYCLLDMTSAAMRKWLEKTDVILLPAGSCEQHGSHLPLGTDAYQALLLACSIAEKGRILAETVADYYVGAIQEIRQIPVHIKNREFKERL